MMNIRFLARTFFQRSLRSMCLVLMSRFYHHGTILIKTDTSKVQQYLKVKESKLRKHGVSSVSSRIVNLSELAPINSDNIIQPLIHAFEETYNNKADICPFDTVCTPEVIKQSQWLASDEFLFDKWKNFHTKQKASFTWGEVEIDIHIDEKKQCISNIEIATDCLHTHIIEEAKKLLIGASTLHAPNINETEHGDILQDIVNLVYNNN